MSNQKRWANKEEAKTYMNKLLKEGKTGLSFCAVCDFLGLVPVDVIEAHKTAKKQK